VYLEFCGPMYSIHLPHTEHQASKHLTTQRQSIYDLIACLDLLLIQGPYL